MLLRRSLPIVRQRAFHSSRARLASVVHGSPVPEETVIPSWATFDPTKASGSNPVKVLNLLDGKWVGAKENTTYPDPLNGEPFMQVSRTEGAELDAFIESMKKVPKTGLHNPFKNKERYLLYGEVCHAAGEELSRPEVHDYMAKTIMRVMPKSYYQAWYETKVTADFLKNWGGDQPRFNAAGMHVAGDHLGQESRSYRWPYGPVALICPFNFPLEIPVLQLMGALMMGNKPLLKPSSNVAAVMEQFLRLLVHVGMPAEDVNLLNCSGSAMGELLEKSKDIIRMTQFTGSSAVGEKLAVQLSGKIKLEDAGFDWKILGPDVNDVDYVAWVADQDAYACSGQKCSAQSICFMHENWVKAGFEEKIKALASRRKFDDLTIGPVMSHTTENIMQHKDNLLKIPGARVAFGGNPLTGHSVPDRYGMVEPTAVYVPLEELLKPGNFELCTTEIFGPFQVLTSYSDANLTDVLDACEKMSHHLTAAVVSNDPRFTDEVIGKTVNGTTYSGLKARTTGAPQNHWFGPAGDPRGAGIGTPGAIQLVWSCHREVISDTGAVPDGWTTPPPS